MNPSTEDILTAIEAVNAEKVIILPNNKNIFMAAKSAAERADYASKKADRVFKQSLKN
jgi:dihydroxyacetone kinase-like predicted kinase